MPRTGRDIPFTIENFPYTDSFGRETVTFVRTFSFPRRSRRFDATMVFSPERGCIVDYLGTHQHLATDLHFEADEAGALVIRSGEHRFREGRLDVRVPDLIGGDAVVRESYDDEAGRFRIQVSRLQPAVRPALRLRGLLLRRVHRRRPPAECAAGLRPVREEARA